MIDLRSDTVTRPSDLMWETMRHAPLGDDVLGDEPTVITLQEKVADLLGKEAALYTPSGTMANQIAIRSTCESGDEIIAHRDNHIVHYETGAPAALSGCMVHVLQGEGGLFDADQIHDSVRTTNIHDPNSRMVVVENTHNRGGGCVWPIEQFNRVAEAAHEHGLHVHVDGARLMNACIASEYSAREFVAAADSVSMCFSKGLGAPVGSALAGSEAMINRARRFRKMFGGGMRQSGIIAAAAVYALDHNIDRLAEDHANAKTLAGHIEEIDGLTVEPPNGGIRTNMVYFHVNKNLGTAAEFTKTMTSCGVEMLPIGPNRVRAVLHLDISSNDVAEAAQAMANAVARVGSPG